MTFFLWGAAASAAITFAIHTFAGGKAVARPLLADENLPKASKWLNYYCWHITTVVIAFIAAMFARLAITAPQTDIIFALSSLTTILSLLSAGVAIKAGVNPLQFPSTTLFAIIAAFGWLALFAGP
jgi:uncharacterized membrane protein HdeD (DUF308 family)